jgi:hypothetical protein
MQNRDRHVLGVWDDPGSAAHRFTLRRIRETAPIWRARGVETRSINAIARLIRQKPYLSHLRHGDLTVAA